MFDIILFYAILAAVFTFGKQIVTLAQPFFACAIRLIPAGLLLLAVAYKSSKEKLTFNKKDFPTLIGLIIFVFFMDVFRFVGLQYVASSYGALLSTLSPFMAALFSYYLYKEKLNVKKLAALTLGVGAVLPVIIQSLRSCTDCTSWQLAIGYGALTISTAAVVIRSYFLKNLVGARNYSISFILGMTYLCVGSIALGISLATESWNPIPTDNIMQVAPYILFILISYSLLAQPLFAYLMKKYSVTLVTFFILSTPLITAGYNWLFYGIKVGIPFLLACVGVGVAFILFNHEERKVS